LTESKKLSSLGRRHRGPDGPEGLQTAWPTGERHA
jgi:hypothetical protein